MIYIMLLAMLILQILGRS